MNNKIKQTMKMYGITYADMGKKLNRSPATVKQRLDTGSTFHKHTNTYMIALNECIEDREKALEKLNE